jgi:hypothetical protein
MSPSTCTKTVVAPGPTPERESTPHIRDAWQGRQEAEAPVSRDICGSCFTRVRKRQDGAVRCKCGATGQRAAR